MSAKKMSDIKETITIYDTKNKNKPLKCFSIDASEFLGHPSKRWSKEPVELKKASKKAKEVSAKVLDKEL